MSALKFTVLSFALTTALSLSSLAQAGEIPAKAESCFACHGPQGKSSNPMFPILAGQSARYIYLELRDYKEGARSHPIMSQIAAGLSKEEMQALAGYFAEQKPYATSFKADPAKVKLGGAKAEETLCAMCHQGGLKGQNEIPRLAGQHPEYIQAQLLAFKNHTRTNDAGNMSSVSKTLSEEDIVNLSHYISTLN